MVVVFDLRPDCFHVESFDLIDEIGEGIFGEGARLGEHPDLLPEHHERRDRSDAEISGQLLLVLGVHLGKHDVRVLLGYLLVHGTEGATGTAPFRPKVDQNDVVFDDGLLEGVLGQGDRCHVGGDSICAVVWVVNTKRPPCIPEAEVGARSTLFAMPGATLVELDGVGVRVGPTPIIRDVEFRLLDGEAVGLFGPNGAGKTTLLRLIATLLPPSEGSGSVLGADLSGQHRFDVRRSIGFVGHVPSLFPELTLIENLEFSAKVAGSPNGSARDVLETVGLAGAGERRADACSHGMQRRAEFARELMLDRELLLLDEPHSALDEDAVELVETLVAAVTARGGGAVLASHERTRVEAMVDRSVELKSGTLL